MPFIRRRWPLILIALSVLAFAVYLIPWVNVRVNWQLDVAQTIIRSRLNPAGALPPPQVASSGAAPTTGARPTPRPPEPTAQFTATPLPASVQLTPAAWESQTPNNCGPATLSMYLNYYGWDGDQATIADEIKPVSADRNVNVDELRYFVRNWSGWLMTDFRVGGDIQLLKQFLAAGIPVIIEEGEIILNQLGNDDNWAAHYILLTGYDDADSTFTYQDSFRGPNQEASFDQIDEFWQQFNRVYFFAYLPDQEGTVKSILGESWDEDANRQNALAVAQDEVQADGGNAFAWFNLGMNQVHFEDYGSAANSFDEARRLGLPMRMLRYQFGPFFAYYNTNRLDDLAQMIDYALQITPNSEEALLWKGWLLLKTEGENAAIEQFRLAQQENPKSIYVEQALTSVGATP